MKPNEILNMTVANMLDILTDNNSDVLEFELTKDDGTGISFRFSYALLGEE